MLCWQACGEHAALKRYKKRIGILILAEGKPTSTARLFITEGNAIPLRRTPLGGPYSAGEHLEKMRRLKDTRSELEF